MNVGGSPSVELRAAMQQHFHQAHHPGVVDLDASDFGFANGDRQSDPLKQWKVDVHVQGLSFETGEAIRHADEFLAQALQIVQPLVETDIFHPVHTDLYPQEGAELFVHAAYQEIGRASCRERGTTVV